MALNSKLMEKLREYHESRRRLHQQWLDLWNTGEVSVHQIADEFGSPECTVRAALKKLGAQFDKSHRGKKKEKAKPKKMQSLGKKKFWLSNAAILVAVLSGSNKNEVAKKLKISRAAVSKTIGKAAAAGFPVASSVRLKETETNVFFIVLFELLLGERLKKIADQNCVSLKRLKALFLLLRLKGIMKQLKELV